MNKMEVNSGQENGKKVMEMVQVAQLIDVPVIAAQHGWKTWEATFGDLSVRCVIDTNTFTDGYKFVASGTDKKKSSTFSCGLHPDIGFLCKMFVETYGRQDAVDRPEW